MATRFLSLAVVLSSVASVGAFGQSPYTVDARVTVNGQTGTVLVTPGEYVEIRLSAGVTGGPEDGLGVAGVRGTNVYRCDRAR